jgi:NADH:ubiquinone oxidoreductase subunit E
LQVIVGQQVTQAANDKQQLVPLVEKINGREQYIENDALEAVFQTVGIKRRLISTNRLG